MKSYNHLLKTTATDYHYIVITAPDFGFYFMNRTRCSEQRAIRQQHRPPHIRWTVRPLAKRTKEYLLYVLRWVSFLLFELIYKFGDTHLCIWHYYWKSL